MDEKVIGLLAAAVGVAPLEAAELVKTDEGIADLLAKHSTKLNDLKRDADGRALRIVTQAFKSAGVEGEVFDSSRPFKDNVSAAVDALKTTTAEKAAGESEAPAVADLKRKLNEATANTERLVAAAREEERTGFAKERAEFDGKQLASRKATLANGYLDVLNPVFGDTTKAASRRNSLVEVLSLIPTVEAAGELFEADSAGEIKRDASGNAIKYADVVRRETEARYDLPVSTDKSSPGVTQRDVAATDARPIKTKEDYEAAYIKNQADSAALDKLEADYPEFAKP